MENLIDILINTFVNMYQGIMVTYILVESLGCKEKDNKKLAYLVGISAIFVLLEVQFFITAFEGFGVFVLIGVCFSFSIFYLQGSIIHKILYNAILFAIVTFTAVASGMLVGSIANVGYIDLVATASGTKYVSMLLNQILLFIVARLFVGATRRRRMGENNRYTVLAVLLATISATTLIVLLKLIDSNGREAFIYACGVAVGLILLATTSLIMYSLAEKSYSEKLQQELELRAFRTQKHDVEEINRNVKEVEMVRHEMNKVLSTINGLLQNENYAEAKSFANEFEKEEVDKLRKIRYTDNTILNYLLERKIEECRQNDIDIKYIINGSFDGVKDIDLHCIFSNLIDNAIEAVKDMEDRSIEVSMSGSEHSIFVEISNRIGDNVLEQNPSFTTTKREKNRHGYGIQNVKNVVSRYNGRIEYKQKLEGYLTCQVIIMKEFTT